MYRQLFWLAAGLWNIFIAAALWNVLTKKDKKLQSANGMRAGVFLFGVGYIAVGYFDWLWWFILVGMAAKLGVVLDYFGSKFDFEKLRPDLLTYIVLGDVLWIFGFGIMLGLELSAMKARK